MHRRHFLALLAGAAAAPALPALAAPAPGLRPRLPTAYMMREYEARILAPTLAALGAQIERAVFYGRADSLLSYDAEGALHVVPLP